MCSCSQAVRGRGEVLLWLLAKDAQFLDVYNMAVYSIKESLGKSSVTVSRKDIIPPLPDSVAKKHMC